MTAFSSLRHWLAIGLTLGVFAVVLGLLALKGSSSPNGAPANVPAQDKDKPREWPLFGGSVARNLVINWLKHRDRRVVATGGSDLQAMLDRLPAADGPQSAEFDRELLDTAAAQVRHRVDSKTWEAFRLTALEGRSGAEVAAALQMQVGAVFKAKSKVQKMLRQEIEGLESEETPCPPAPVQSSSGTC